MGWGGSLMRMVLRWPAAFTDRFVIVPNDDKYTRQCKYTFIMFSMLFWCAATFYLPIMYAIGVWIIGSCAVWVLVAMTLIILIAAIRKSIFGLRVVFAFALTVAVQFALFDIHGCSDRAWGVLLSLVAITPIQFMYGRMRESVYCLLISNSMVVAQIFLERLCPEFVALHPTPKYPVVVNVLAWSLLFFSQSVVLLAMAYYIGIAQKEQRVVTSLLYDILPEKIAEEIAAQRAQGQTLVHARERVAPAKRVDQDLGGPPTSPVSISRHGSDRLTVGSFRSQRSVRRPQAATSKAKSHPWVAVAFLDIVGFTSWSADLAPDVVVRVLSQYFNAFDQCVNLAGVEKIKTIGDAYMCAAGVPLPVDQPCVRLMHALILMMDAVQRHLETYCNSTPEEAARIGLLQLRAGAEVGPVVAGVIGRTRFVYDLWGDTVNTSSRMESSGHPNCIQVTQRFCEALAEDTVTDGWVAQRRTVEVKGKGRMQSVIFRKDKLGGDAVIALPPTQVSTLTTLMEETLPTVTSSIGSTGK